ncbi:MAG: hypothetical protein LBR64_10090 [Dysgonamonadaceae bacterium]|jgi:Icc-related predicted phosphoesterase|nr:hypothetical protein [Dysgonamonadaceae bacterium]
MPPPFRHPLSPPRLNAFAPSRRHHLFGHIHDNYGIQKLRHTTFVNAAILDENDVIKNEPVRVVVGIKTIT